MFRTRNVRGGKKAARREKNGEKSVDDVIGTRPMSRDPEQKTERYA